MKNIFFSIILLVSFTGCKAQHTSYKSSIYFHEIGRILAANELKSEIIDSLPEFKIKYKLLSSKGSMQVTEFYLHSGKIKFVGNYIEPKSISIDSSYQENPENPGIFKTSLIKYYKPLKDGEWLYYNEEGNLEKTETYKKGKLIKKGNW